MMWKTEIEAAARRIHGHCICTPVMQSAALWQEPITLKLEQMQHMGSFKTRGAFNSLRGVQVPKGGVVAASGGNHGAAVGYAAHRLGLGAHIFVPELAGPAKIALIRRSGANLTVVPGDYADALAAAREYEHAHDACQIHAYDAPLTVAGQGTLFREWEAQGLDADTLLIAVGGGGLIAGALAFMNGRRKIVAVEPEKCTTLQAALRAGQPVDVQVSGIAANALGARRIGEICFDLAREQGIETVSVSDEAILAAQKNLWQAHRLLVEPAGACALAALQSGAYRPARNEKVAFLLCGANPAPDPFEA